MFLRMLTAHFDQNYSYEITINGFQVRKISKIRNVIFGLRYGKPSSSLRPKLGCSPSWVLDDIQRFLGQLCLNKHRFVTYVNSIEKSKNNLQIPVFLSSDWRSDNVAADISERKEISERNSERKELLDYFGFVFELT